MLTCTGSSTATTSLSTTTYTDKLNVLGVPDESGFWAVHAFCSVSSSISNRYSDVQLLVDGVVRMSSTTTHSLSGNPTTVYFFEILSLERGKHVFQLQFRRATESAPTIISCSNATLMVSRLY